MSNQFPQLSQLVDKGLEFYQRGQYQKAIEQFSFALDLNPNDGEALSLKGLCLMSLNDFKAAETYLRSATNIEPEQFGFWYNLGFGLGKMGKLSESVAILKEHIPQNSRIEAAWSTLYQNAVKIGDTQAILYGAVRWLQLNFNIRVLQDVIANLIQMGEFDSALDLISKFKDSASTHEVYWQLVCMLDVRLSRWSKLIEHSNAWIKKFGSNKQPLKHLATAYFELGLQHDAIAVFERVLDLGDTDDSDLSTYAELCIETRELSKAETALQQLEKTNFLSPGLLNAQILLNIYQGNKAKAIELTQKCLSNFKDYLPGYAHAVRLEPEILDEPQLQWLADIANDQTQVLRNRLTAAYSIAHSYNAYRHYKTAFDWYSIANSLNTELNQSKNMEYSVSQANERINKIALLNERLDKIELPESNTKSSHLFIVGMPRSGTTLLEGILGCNSRVCMGDERVELPNFLNKLLLSDLDDASLINALLDFRNNYQHAVTDEPTPGIWYTDKNPLNFEAVGLLNKLFPDAKVIAMEREPMETCFSIFRHEFTHLWSFTTSLENIAHQYKHYQKLAGLWSKQFRNFNIINYEELSENPLEIGKGIYSWLGLKWESPDFEQGFKNQRFTTLSAMQVREKITNQNGLAQKYSEQLQTLASALAR